MAIPSTAPVRASQSLELNIFMPESVSNITPLKDLETSLGVNFKAASWYQVWSDPINTAVANHYQAAGILPTLVWQPQNAGVGVAFDQVTAGAYDAYINASAAQVKALGYPIRISLAPEMNSDWVSWGMGKQGNTAANERAFWQYTVQKFRDAGATNAQWVWTPNIHSAGEQYSYADLYPGNAYVDFAGLDGYNWGTTRSWSAWQSFASVFGASYADITAVSSRPVLIMETASAEQGGDKATWIQDMFTAIHNQFTRIQGVSWFNMNKETDWRITSSPASAAAYAAGYVAPVVKPVVSASPAPTAQPEPTAAPKTVAVVQATPAPKATAAPVTTPVPAAQVPTGAVSVTATVINPNPTLGPTKPKNTTLTPTISNLEPQNVSAVLPLSNAPAGVQISLLYTLVVLGSIAVFLNSPSGHVRRSASGWSR